MYKALAISSNVVAVKMIQDVGIPMVIDMAKALGLTTPLTYDYTISLGSNGVKLYDMVIVYGNFANGGYRVQPYAIEKIETKRGKVIYQAQIRRRCRSAYKALRFLRFLQRTLAGYQEKSYAFSFLLSKTSPGSRSSVV